jgi:molecular chaperone DnaK (HSP70)
MQEIIIGIDLGTTNSEVAIVENDRVTIIETAGKKLLPSFVGLADDDKILVGEPAKNQYILYPERTVKSIKRRMGQDETVSLGETAYSPQEISAMILRQLKSNAEAYLGHAITKAVITVPAYFSDAQRQATREAGEIAGLDVVRIINEPTAAALSYEARHQGRKRILVYDLGGGTFDVSVVSIQDDVVEVLASHGNNHLGGDDFDAKLVGYIVDHLQQQDIDISTSRRAMARITRAAETAKIALSDQPYFTIEEEYLIDHNAAPYNLSLEIDRHDYETMIEPYIDETLEAVHIALKGADLTVSDLDEILLVGGATRTPLVTRRLEQELGITPRSEVDPDLCVASGAAIQAAMLAGDEVSAILVDVTPYTFGTSALAELDGNFYPFCFVPIIKKNTPIPVSKSDVVYTTFDGQDEAMVHVYQGEDHDALNNIEIGKFMIEGLSDVPAGNPVIMRFSLDIDGILQVTAQEKNTGLEKSIRIDNAIGRFQEGELRTARERINQLFHEDEQTTIVEVGEKTTDVGTKPTATQHLVVQARALIEKAERMLDEAGDDDREDLINLIEALKDRLSSEKYAELPDTMDELSDILFYLES